MGLYNENIQYIIFYIFASGGRYMEKRLQGKGYEANKKGPAYLCKSLIAIGSGGRI